MIRIAIFVGIVLMGCSPCKNVQTYTNNRDSVRVDVRTETVFVTDTVLVEIPQALSEREVKDSTSFLENDFATSRATVYRDGTLYHNLVAKAQKRPIEVQTKVVYRDSVMYQTKEVERQVVQQVARKMTWWQRTRLVGFWVLLAGFGFILYRKFFK